MWPPPSLWLDGVSVGGSQGTGLELQTSFTGTWSYDKKTLFTAQAAPALSCDLLPIRAPHKAGTGALLAEHLRSFHYRDMGAVASAASGLAPAGFYSAESIAVRRA